MTPLTYTAECPCGLGDVTWHARDAHPRNVPLCPKWHDHKGRWARIVELLRGY